MRRYIHWAMVTLFSILIFNGPAIARGAGGDLAALPNLLGAWSGEADIMLPDGITEQIHLFEFTDQQGAFLKGRHSWDIPAKNP